MAKGPPVVQEPLLGRPQAKAPLDHVGKFFLTISSVTKKRLR